MKKFLAIISCIFLVNGCTKKAEIKATEAQVEEVPEKQEAQIENSKPIETQEKKIEITGQPPKQTGEKFKVDDQDIELLQEAPAKPIMVAVMAPMSGKYDMIGNGIMDGAHMALIELFNKNKIPVRLTVIDTGSGIEDMEFNISKLDETQFDVILGLTWESQREFVKAYIENFQHKPKIMSLLEDDCSISPSDQMKMIKGDKIYVVLPMSDLEAEWKGENVKIMQYSTDDVQITNDDLMKITQKIEEETREKQGVIVFTEGNWKLQKFMTNLDTLKIKDKLDIVLASLSQKNSRMETVNEKRHKFGNISVVAIETSDYNRFIREFQALHNRKPLDISFLAYNAVKSLENRSEIDGKWNFDNVTCKPEIKLFERNYR